MPGSSPAAPSAIVEPEECDAKSEAQLAGSCSVYKVKRSGLSGTRAPPPDRPRLRSGLSARAGPRSRRRRAPQPAPRLPQRHPAPPPSAPARRGPVIPGLRRCGFANSGCAAPPSLAHQNNRSAGTLASARPPSGSARRSGRPACVHADLWREPTGSRGASALASGSIVHGWARRRRRQAQGPPQTQKLYLLECDPPHIR
jgi:hypothetical protein